MEILENIEDILLAYSKDYIQKEKERNKGSDLEGKNENKNENENNSSLLGFSNGVIIRYYNLILSKKLLKSFYK